jgi:hypothetical protein
MARWFFFIRSRAACATRSLIGSSRVSRAGTSEVGLSAARWLSDSSQRGLEGPNSSQ